MSQQWRNVMTSHPERKCLRMFGLASVCLKEMTTMSNNANNTATVVNSTLLSTIQNQQLVYANARGRKALAQMVGDAYEIIVNQLLPATKDDQVALLNRFKIPPATGKTSEFTPWIAAFWGEEDPDESKTFKALDGQYYRRWVPNRSMSVYFHTMEALADAGIESDAAAWIMAKGGAQVVANVRKRRIADEGKPSLIETQNTQRDLYLSDGPHCALKLPKLAVPDDVEDGQFFSIIVEKTADGFAFRGISETDASAKLARLAADSWEKLSLAVVKNSKKPVIDASGTVKVTKSQAKTILSRKPVTEAAAA
ncbi:hypothetical protein KCP91_11995 [Microvirga sp. SRT01]|uniref:Uncharacterized protein n=1 Tax=Sphingomonas longa TaxID=2778730 RepID=A0ABS2DAQ4_9SPHN|nr:MULTISPECIES: hypothetical protein [Alphaproteobacteria]MBM6577094.1 hypothetical protein [Sphingomonas sp. BT552]MBR7710138.1 hypothetical protein [Microvirga sp. SRT01]